MGSYGIVVRARLETFRGALEARSQLMMSVLYGVLPRYFGLLYSSISFYIFLSFSYFRRLFFCSMEWKRRKKTVALYILLTVKSLFGAFILFRKLFPSFFTARRFSLTWRGASQARGFLFLFLGGYLDLLFRKALHPLTTPQTYWVRSPSVALDWMQAASSLQAAAKHGWIKWNPCFCSFYHVSCLHTRWIITIIIIYAMLQPSTDSGSISPAHQIILYDHKRRRVEAPIKLSSLKHSRDASCWRFHPSYPRFDFLCQSQGANRTACPLSNHSTGQSCISPLVRSLNLNEAGFGTRLVEGAWNDDCGRIQ